MKKTELQTMVVAELKALAKKMKIKIPSSLRKAEIVDVLATAFKKEVKPAAAAQPLKAVKTAASRDRKPASPKSIIIEKKTDSPKSVEIAVAKKPATKPASALPKPSVQIPPAGREWKVPPKAEEPIMMQERVSDAKYYTGPGQEQAQGSHELPLGYGEEKVAIMPRDPYIAYVYWETTRSRIEREKAWFGWNAKLTVRIYDVTGVQFDGRNAIGYYDQEVHDLAGHWYFDLGRPSHSFLADIGLLSPDGRFLTLARSNYVTMPRDGVSDVVDEEWMLADEEFWKIYGFPGGLSSLQLQEMVKTRRAQQVISSGSLWGERPKRK